MAALQPQIVTNPALQLQEWKQPVTSEESTFVQAIIQVPINKSTVEELKQVMRLVIIKVGLRAQNFPDDVEKSVLIEHIITNYGNHTPAEIKLAFDMAIGGKLDLEEKEVICYENFTCIYLSKILNSYRRWASTAYRELKKDNVLQISDNPDNVNMMEWIAEWKAKPEIKIPLIPSSFYDYLIETKTIKVTNNKKYNAMERACNAIKAELKNEIPIINPMKAERELADFIRMEKEGFTGQFKTRILNRAKRFIVYDYLTKK